MYLVLERMAESPSLEVFTKYGDVALRNMVCEHGGVGLMVGLGDLGSNLYDCMFLRRVSSYQHSPEK